MRKTAGFTLIEIVVTMVIVGIMASIAGLGILTGVRGYVFAKNNTSISEKAQLAMSRINRTFIEVLDISTITSSPARVTYNRLVNGVSTQETLYLDSSDNTVKIAPGSSTTGGDTLVDSVNSLTMTFKNGAATWSVSDSFDKLSTVEVSLVMSRTDGGNNVTFGTVISPRNNANRGGSTSTATSPNASYGCFVATAAFGKPDHPIVMVLRDFRDTRLLTWPLGRLFVKAYYAYGPYVADLIRDNYWACVFTQIFLLPVAGTAFLILYMPQVIPLMVLSAFILSVLIFRRVRNAKMSSFRPAGQKGSALLGLVATIVVFAILGAALLSMTSSSTFSQIIANSSTRAYYLAEGGMRYAASQFRNASTESAKDAMLLSLHNDDFALSSDGTFHLEIYPYYFKTTSAASGTTLATKFCGGVPSDMTIPNSGYLKIGDNATPVYYSSRNISGTNVTFTCTSVTAANDVTVLPVAVASSQTLTNGGNLTLSSGYTSFPAINGSFTVGSASSTAGTSTAVYSYKRRSGNVLYEVYLSTSSSTSFSLSVPSGAYITLMKFISLRSRGTYGAGTTYAASRTISYSIPIGYISSGASKTAPFTEMFSDASDLATYWNTSAELGTFAISSGALSVTGTQSIYLTSGAWYLRTSLLTLNWGSTGVNLNACWGAMGNLLSYDVQTKVKVTNTSSARYYMAGVVFRVDTSGQMYGVSFLRPNPGTFIGIDYDKIPDDVCPLSSTTPMIVLWQEAPYGTITWLAYKTLTEDSGRGIVNSSGYLVDWSTLLVRVIEADSLQFNNGSGTTFEFGDVVTGAISGATAVVSGTPILTSGSWGSNAAGWLTISGSTSTSYKNSSGVIQFQSGEDLRVNGVIKARYTGSYRLKDNYIRAYYGKTAAAGSANSTPTDNNRLANPVLTSTGQSLTWPVDNVTEWAAANDYFTLVQWTAINSGAGGSIALLGTGTEANAIVRTNMLVTPSSGTFTQPEVGLDTWGNGSTYTFFDDFGLQAWGPGQTQGFLPGIQQ
jgi:prepilin-type N-terminal cleavage/methylation domain-containing protein